MIRHILILSALMSLTQGKRLIDVGGTRMLITPDGITVNKPIQIGAIPDIPIRGKR